jgi:drug/metabolite transporter (DMT)-like permease
MTVQEIVYCMTSVFFSSSSQLLFKSIFLQKKLTIKLIILGIGAIFVLASVFFVVAALKTLPIKDLVLFASFAYILIPLGGYFIFKEKLSKSFWLGALLIVLGVVCTTY